MKTVKLIADQLQVRSHLVGGNNKLTFDVGSYQLEELAKLLLVPEMTEIKLTVEWEDGRAE
jgi:hypothetical protein